jgi:hypothetical protein
MSAVAPLPPQGLALHALHAGFLALLPRVELYARVFFRHLRCGHRQEEAVAEAAALAWKW